MVTDQRTQAALHPRGNRQRPGHIKLTVSHRSPLRIVTDGADGTVPSSGQFPGHLRTYSDVD